MWRLVRTLLALALMGSIGSPAAAQPYLADYLDRLPPGELVPGAERFGPVAGDPPAAPAYGRRGEEEGQDDEEDEQDEGELLGYLFMNSDVVDSYGYSAKPIHIAVGLDTQGRIVGTRLVEHSEPIVLIGIPEKRMTDFIAGYVGRDVMREAREAGEAAQVDAISGATVTVLVIDESITRGAYRVAQSLGLGAPAAPGGQERRRARRGTQVQRTLDMEQTGSLGWEQLLEEGSVARLHLTVGEVNAAFERLGGEAAKRPLQGDPEDTVSELYVALVSAPVIGRSLLGEREYALLRERLEPGQQAVLIGGSGSYSWRGSGYVRGGIFDRVRLVQEQSTIRFHDREYKRIGDLAASGAPDLREIGLFTIPAGARFDATRPWRLELLVQRAIGALDKVFLNFDLRYQVPEKYLEPAPAPEPALPAQAPPPPAAEPARTPLWQRIWSDRAVDIAILCAGLVVLMLIFLFQDWLAKRPRLKDGVRLAFLAFTLFWIGWYANAQLSVVNVLTFTNALATEFRWDFFLMDPLVFILWSTVAVTLLFWGRGPFCGWLCPFGALQEFLNRIARWFRVPQLPVRFGLHERLWPIKYIIFLALFGLALYSLTDAERFAEVEPFKTAIILDFVREWPFVVYALLLLAAGLFIERFFCRYLCPLGAALAIPGRMRMFEWLKRYKECGHPCQRCRNECPVPSIHPEGQINPNECIYCLHCQVLYHDDHRCPVMIQHRLRHERAAARAPKRSSFKETAPSGAPGDDQRQ